MSESVTLPAGDPIYSIYIWRQDSVTLARLRPLLEEIVVLADAPCEGPWMSDTCLTVTRKDIRDTQPGYCWPCRLKQIRARLYGYRTQPRKEENDDDGDRQRLGDRDADA